MRAADVDASGHVTDVAVLRYLQEARVDLLYVHAPAEGAGRLASGVLVVRHEVAYLRPLPAADSAVVSTWVHRIGAARLALGYEVTSGADSGDVRVRASTVLAPYDPGAGRPRRLDAEELTVLDRYLHPELVLPRAPEPGPAPDPARPVQRFACAVRFDDLDLYGHVNNVTYLTYLEEARRTTRGPAPRLCYVQIAYRRPIAFRTAPVTVETRVAGTTATETTYEQVVRDGDDVFVTAVCTTAGAP